MNEYTPELFELEDENGEKQTFELLDTLEYEGEVYYAMTPFFDDDQAEEYLESDAEVVILKVEYDENNEEVLVSIDSESEYEKIGAIFMEKISDMFEFDDDDDCCDDDCDCHGHE